MTSRLVRCVEELCKVLPIKHVSTLVGLSWNTVKRIDKARLIRELPSIAWGEVRRLAIDEFALHKGHRYATVVADADTRQVLWVGEGRSRLDLRPFFEQLGEYAKSIEAVAMDQNSAFDLEVKLHCPQAEVVYDLFHVVAKYGREVIDRVRVDQANTLRSDKPARRAVKRSRWLLLKNRSNLSGKQEAKLEELIAINQPLATVYVLKEQLKELWRCRNAWEAFKLWRQWWRSCRESGLKPLMDFARKLLPYLRGILASAKYPLNTSVLEGMNNKIKVIKRMAYGYRDIQYFFLKIKHAFPAKW
ncbi:ISL3 family transposase [Pelagicoccus mobilis]|uniref:ISL3 family transposase n=1 Tax=Pelagicoccus mobilis TaxID=415221 RepID=A0A934VQL3_9BACT|nr:ISL3 family transposase [Pelagicoccus mobilis]